MHLSWSSLGVTEQSSATSVQAVNFQPEKPHGWRNGALFCLGLFEQLWLKRYAKEGQSAHPSGLVLSDQAEFAEHCSGCFGDKSQLGERGNAYGLAASLEPAL